MKGLGRNLKYWFLYFGKMLLIEYGVVVLVVGLTTFFDGEFPTDTFFFNMGTYTLMLSVILVVVYAFTNMSTVYPMTVTLGTRRCSSLIAMTLAEHAIVFASIVVSIFFFNMFDRELGSELLSHWISIAAAWFLLMALGNLEAIISAKLGRVIGMILYIIAVLVCSVGVGILLAGDHDISTFLGKTDTGLTVIALAVAFILDMFMTSLLIFLSSRSELKFA